MNAIIRRAAFPIIVLGTGKGLALLAKIFLARFITPEEFGQFNVFIAVIAIAATFSVLGMQKGVVKELANAIHQDERGVIQGLAIIPFAIIVLVSLSISSAFYYIAPSALANIVAYRQLLDIWPWLFACITAQALIMYLAHYLLAHGLSNTFLIGSELLFNSMFFLLLVIMYLSSSLNLQTIITVFTIASWTAVGVLLYRIYVLLKEHGHLDFAAIKKPTRTFYSYSSTLLISTLCYIALSSADRIMLAFYVDHSEIALYSAAYTIAVTMPIFLIAADAYLSPRFASAIAGNQKNQVQNLYHKSNSLLLIAASAIAVLVIMLSEFIMGIFGGFYLGAAAMMVLLLFGEYINTILGTTGRLLQIANHQKLEANLVILAVLLNIALNCILIPHYGVMGAISATVATRLLHTLAKASVVRSKLGITTWSQHDTKLNTFLLTIVIIIFIIRFTVI